MLTPFSRAPSKVSLLGALASNAPARPADCAGLCKEPSVKVEDRRLAYRPQHNGRVPIRLGEQAVDHGYTVEQLFGVHRLAGAMRADSTGVLVTIYPYRVVALSEAEIVLEPAGTRLTFRGLTNPAEAIPLWEFPGARART